MNSDNLIKRSLSTPPERLKVIGCGILQKEVEFLIRKNDWPLDTCFLDSTFHNNLYLLSESLEKAIVENKKQDLFILYGACHPLMDRILERHRIFRTEGQNCIEMLLGAGLFRSEVEGGAFFLLEDWATHWSKVMKTAYGNANSEIIREIFISDRKYFLGVRTPCSDNFESLALGISTDFDVPLCWIDIDLGHFESVLEKAVHRALEQQQ